MDSLIKKPQKNAFWVNINAYVRHAHCTYHYRSGTCPQKPSKRNNLGIWKLYEKFKEMYSLVVGSAVVVMSIK